MQFKIASQQRAPNRIHRSNAKKASSTRVRRPDYHLQRTIGNSATSRLTNRIQTKLTVSNPHDSAEREADRFADQLMRAPESQSDVDLQAKPAGTSAAPEATEEVESYVNGVKGGGQPLSASSHEYFSSRVGYDFSNVRVHTDSRANESARAINAKAYTIGNDIVFATGQHSPDTQQGQRLLAHELAHVVQQSGSHASRTVQRSVQEAPFPGGGKADDVRAGEHLLWNFDIGQHKLRPEHAAPLKKIAAEIKAALTRDPSALIDIEGQASFTGTRNDELSTKRAESVKKALVDQGIAADRLNIIAAGSIKSLPGETQENFARSRAVRVITPPHLLLPVGPQPVQQTGACQAQASNMVLDGGTVDVTNEGLFKRLHAGDGNPPGMTMSTGVSVNPADCGTLLYVQNVQAFRQIIYKDRTRNTLQTSGFVLDTEDPYPTQVFDGKDPSNPGLKIAMANDSPGQRIHTGFDLEAMMKVVEARDDFRMFLLFEPKGGARQVLQIGEWSWSGQLNSSKPDSLTEGVLGIDRSVSRIMPTSGKGRPTGEPPVLAPNVTSADWVTNNGGLQKTFADLHRPLLNRVKPRATPKR
ncbi:MAG TPA: DUF4157 domain-containing protein [Pyrinomonadaceae bacterium]|nr:DUF4157 domain-containing protein [Pyrinomonadaceae bacterium]